MLSFIVVFLLIVVNGLLSMAEMAIVSARKPRLQQMADLLTTVEGVVNRFLVDPASSRAALAFVAGLPFTPKPKKKP